MGGWPAPFNNGGSGVPTAGILVKSGACVVGAVSIQNTTSGAVWIQVYDASSANSSNYTAANLRAWTLAQIGNGTSGSAQIPAGGVKCAAGCVVVLSSTQFTYTAIGSTSAILMAYVE